MALTIARFAAAPIVAGLLLGGSQALFTEGRDLSLVLYALALVVFVLAALTDWLDGMLARKLNATSALGAALDHSADKALTTATLVILAATALPIDLIVAAAILVTRDVAVGGLREGLALSGRKLPVDSIGKVKTVVLMIGIGAAIAFQVAALTIPAGGGPFSPLDAIQWLTRAALWGAVVLALWSAAEYFGAAFKKT
ncbi:MAG: pgsA [Caulobacteraceae bacterium]|nr:MAG: pgsA [Caulobacteraceae bacterium]